jgi:hypothetical protein
LTHFHLQYFPRGGTPTTNYSASFFSEIEAVHGAGLANATRGAETGYYSIQQCHRGACRPEPLVIEIERRPTPEAPSRARVRRLPGVLN